MEPVEFTRARYRPDRITTLFVGESAPASGAFSSGGSDAETGAFLANRMNALSQRRTGPDTDDKPRELGWIVVCQ